MSHFAKHSLAIAIALVVTAASLTAIASAPPVRSDRAAASLA